MLVPVTTTSARGTSFAEASLALGRSESSSGVSDAEGVSLWANRMRDQKDLLTSIAVGKTDAAETAPGFGATGGGEGATMISAPEDASVRSCSCVPLRRMRMASCGE